MALTVTHTYVNPVVDEGADVTGPDEWNAAHTLAGSIAASEVTSGAAITKVDDTNVTLTLGGSAATALLAAASLTLGWTGTLSPTRGGTGLSALGTGVATWLGTPSSANLAAALTDETGTGAAVFGTSPTITTSVTITGGTVTVSTPVIDATQTWNAGGVTFTGILANFTNTASANGSKLFDLQVGGTSKFSVFRTSVGTANQSGILVQGADTDRTNIRIANTTGHNFDFFSTGSGNSNPNTFGVFDDTAGVTCLALSTTVAGLPSGSNFGWSSGSFPPSTMDTGLSRNAAGIVEVNNGTAGTFRDLKARKLATPVTSTLTIATGAVTATGGYHLIDTEAAAATDDLDTINGGVDGAILIIRAADSARTVVAKDATGNLQLAGDHTMDNAQDTLTLFFVGALSAWLELSRSDNGA